MAAREWSYEEIVRDVKGRRFYPIYLLMGDEPFFQDLISQCITECVLSEEERDFNQVVLYGMDCDVASVVSAAKRYPMMSEYQLVVVKEAQLLKRPEDLGYYFERPLHSTILVLEFRGMVDRRKGFVSLAAKNGVLFESKRLYDNKIPGFISSYLKERGYQTDSKAAQMLVDFLGNDLCKIAGELDKLIISMGKDERIVTPELVERNIGISKDFNNFEFLDALISGDVVRANRIAIHLSANSKSYPLVVTLSVLFNFFSNLMVAHYLPDKSENGLMAGLSLKRSFLVKPYILGLRRFSAQKTMDIISLIRSCDAQSKGVGGASVCDGDLLRNLVFNILH